MSHPPSFRVDGDRLEIGLLAVARAGWALFSLAAVFLMVFLVAADSENTLARATFALAVTFFIVQLFIALFQVWLGQKADALLHRVGNEVTDIRDSIRDTAASSDDPDDVIERALDHMPSKWIPPAPTTLRGQYAEFLHQKGWSIVEPPASVPRYAVIATKGSERAVFISTTKGRRGGEAAFLSRVAFAAELGETTKATPILVVGSRLDSDHSRAAGQKFPEVQIVEIDSLREPSATVSG